MTTTETATTTATTAATAATAATATTAGLAGVCLTEVELDLLEESHLRLLGEPVLDPAWESSRGEVEEASRAQARASLTARGLLDAEGGLVEEGAVGELLATALDLRAASPLVVVVDRFVGAAAVGSGEVGAASLGAGQPMVAEEAEEAEEAVEVEETGQVADARLLHVHPAGICLEDVHATGLRALALLPTGERAVRAVVEVLVPPDAVAGTGPPRAADPDPEVLMTQLGRPSVLAEIAAAGEDLEIHLVALGPGGCFVATRDLEGGAGSAPEDASPMTFHPIAPDWVERWARRTVLGEQGTVPDGAQ